MQFRTSFLTLLLATFLLAFTACKKDDNSLDFNPNDTGSIVLEFDNVVGDKPLELDKGTYTNALGEQFSISLFQYFISNIALTTEDGREYVVPQDESYFIIQQHKAHTHSVILKDIPAGNYTQVRFIIGVDSLRNTMEPEKRTGVLDVANYVGAEKMYWSWNSGYIFVKIEGNSPQAPVGNDGQQRFRYHIGGFGGYSSPTINNIKETKLSFGKDVAKVRKDKTPDVHIKADLLKAFNGNPNISIAANPSVHFAPFSVNIANNYVHMFNVDHVHN